MTLLQGRGVQLPATTMQPSVSSPHSSFPALAPTVHSARDAFSVHPGPTHTDPSLQSRCESTSFKCFKHTNKIQALNHHRPEGRREKANLGCTCWTTGPPHKVRKGKIWEGSEAGKVQEWSGQDTQCGKDQVSTRPGSTTSLRAVGWGREFLQLEEHRKWQSLDWNQEGPISAQVRLPRPLPVPRFSLRSTLGRALRPAPQSKTRRCPGQGAWSSTQD